MSSPYPIEPYIRPAPTRESLDFAPLAALDLSKVKDWSKSEGKEELVKDLRRAIEEVGFFYVVGHGIKDLDVRRQLALGELYLGGSLSSETETDPAVSQATPSSSSRSRRSLSTLVTSP
jgi:soluble P-type ATPase